MINTFNTIEGVQKKLHGFNILIFTIWDWDKICWIQPVLKKSNIFQYTFVIAFIFGHPHSKSRIKD